MQKCPFCQFENEDGALFCEQCKSDLGATEPVATLGTGEPPPADTGEGGYDTMPAHELREHAASFAAVAVDEAAVTEAVPVAEVAPEGTASADTVAPVAEATPVPSPAESAPAEAPPAPPETDARAAETAAEPTAPFVPPAPSPLPAASPAGAPAEVAKLPAGSKPKLVVFRGQKVNAEYPLYEGDNYIGRADDKPVDIDLEDQEPPDRIWSSRQHAIITFEDGRLAIEDLNSTNGTFVNRTRVHPGQKRPLQINDVIQVGTVQMRLKV